MFSIHLQNLQFFAYHGCHEEERILGNEFEVNADISIEGTQAIQQLDQTIDYATVFRIIKERMAIPVALLETLIADMAADIHAEFPSARSINISIIKKHPPITGIQGSVAVSLHKEY